MRPTSPAVVRGTIASWVAVFFDRMPSNALRTITAAGQERKYHGECVKGRTRRLRTSSILTMPEWTRGPERKAGKTFSGFATSPARLSSGAVETGDYLMLIS